jgi:hypothetical protein
MSTKLALLAGSDSSWHGSQSLSRVVKVAVTAFALLYMINGTGAAAGYANSLRMEHDSSVKRIAEMVWVGVAWPIVLHDMMRAAPLQRV